MLATCVLGHESELGDVPTDQGAVIWECPDCQARDTVPGTEPLEVAAPESAEGVTHVSDGDAGTGTSTQ